MKIRMFDRQFSEMIGFKCCGERANSTERSEKAFYNSLCKDYNKKKFSETCIPEQREGK